MPTSSIGGIAPSAPSSSITLDEWRNCSPPPLASQRVLMSHPKTKMSSSGHNTTRLVSCYNVGCRKRNLARPSPTREAGVAVLRSVASALLCPPSAKLTPSLPP